jgi:hypothetical protein
MPNYRVWIEQINATYVEVKAPSSSQAKERAERKWRREYAQPVIVDLRELSAPTAKTKKQ